MEQHNIHLVDGHVYIFRAHFVMPDMRAPDGTATGAAYGFTNMLLRHCREARPSHFAVCFDHAMTSFRNEIEPEYKAQRGEPDEELEPHIVPNYPSAAVPEMPDSSRISLIRRRQKV